jgi:hypothetical protein
MFAGEWLLVLVHLTKYLGYNKAESNFTFTLSNISLECLYLKNVQYHWLAACITSYGMYFFIGGFINVSCQDFSGLCLRIQSVN